MPSTSWQGGRLHPLRCILPEQRAVAPPCIPRRGAFLTPRPRPTLRGLDTVSACPLNRPARGRRPLATPAPGFRARHHAEPSAGYDASQRGIPPSEPPRPGGADDSYRTTRPSQRQPEAAAHAPSADPLHRGRACAIAGGCRACRPHHRRLRSPTMPWQRWSTRRATPAGGAGGTSAVAGPARQVRQQSESNCARAEFGRRYAVRYHRSDRRLPRGRRRHHAGDGKSAA